MHYFNLGNVKNFFKTNVKLKKFPLYISNLLSFNFLISDNSIADFSNLGTLSLHRVVLSVEHIKIQELTFLSEYFLITALFCLTLFALFSLKIVTDEKHFSVKFQYNNQLIFLLIFVLTCYLVLVYQQMNLSLLALTSFNDTIYNDQLAIVSKLIIGISCILYLIFTTQYLQDQKLSNFEYYIILLTSIFGFFLLCGANDLITAYLAIELQGLAFYVLASFKKSSNSSIESGVKYFVLGSLSTALFLLGVTLIYGLSGSLLLTDFKDLFIWVFSANSLFLSTESVYKALGAFQKETKVIGANFGLPETQVMLEKLSLLKKKAYHFVLKTSNLSFPEAFTATSLASDFLIESNFQDAPVEFLQVLQNNKLDYESFIHLRSNLFEANYYENLDESHGLVIESVGSKSDSLNFLQINENIGGGAYLNSAHDLLQCCHFAGFSHIDGNLQSEAAVSSNEIKLETTSKFLLIPESFSFLVTDITNFNNLFLESCTLNSKENTFMFDFSFVISGVLLVVFALFFKLALAPFHLWVPDVYEGSPSSSTFFFMVISKLSIFIFLLRICYSGFFSLISYWQFYSLTVATLSVFVGAVAGLKQRRLKSLLTYSSINNMGFVLLAFSAGSFEGVQVQFFYLIVYMLASVGIWSTILNLKLKKKMYAEKQNKDLGDLALLQESNPIIAQNLGVTLFSLAGLPPTVGFIAKMGVFKALVGVSVYFFAVINVLFSVIATFYYLRIVKIIFFENNLLVGNLYETISSKKIFLMNLLSFLLLFLFVSPMMLYLQSYKITLFLNKAFY